MAGGISGIDAALRKEPSPGDDLGLYEQMVPGLGRRGGRNAKPATMPT